MAQKAAALKAQPKRKIREPDDEAEHSSKPLLKKSHRSARIIRNDAASPNGAQDGLKITVRFDTPKKKRKLEDAKWTIPKKRKLENESKKSLEPPPKLPQQLLNMLEDAADKSTPKVAVNRPNNSNFLPPTPSSSTGSPDYRPDFSYTDLLTPNSTPNEEVEIDPLDSIISTIINWDAVKIMEKQFRTKPFFTKSLMDLPVPKQSFEDRSKYEKCVHSFVLLSSVISLLSLGCSG